MLGHSSISEAPLGSTAGSTAGSSTTFNLSIVSLVAAQSVYSNARTFLRKPATLVGLQTSVKRTATVKRLRAQNLALSTTVARQIAALTVYSKTVVNNLGGQTNTARNLNASRIKATNTGAFTAAVRNAQFLRKSAMNTGLVTSQFRIGQYYRASTQNTGLSTVRKNGSFTTSGLILNLDAGNASSYPGSGTTWYDLSGNSNNFTIEGTLTFSSLTGFSGFNSTTRIYRSSFPTNLKTSQGGNGCTTIVWAKNNGVSGKWQKLIGNGDEQNYIDIYLRLDNGKYWSEDGSSLFVNDNQSYGQNVFYGGTGDWIMFGSTNSNGGTTTNPTDAFGIGMEGDLANDYPWNGNIAVVLIYNRVLSGTEIVNIYNYYAPRFYAIAGVYAISKSSNLGLSTSFVRYNPVAYRTANQNLALQSSYVRQVNYARKDTEVVGLQTLTRRTANANRADNDIAGLSSSYAKVLTANKLRQDNAGLQTQFTRLANATRVTANNIGLQTVRTLQLVGAGLYSLLRSNLVGTQTARYNQVIFSRKDADNLGTTTAYSRLTNATRYQTNNTGLQTTIARQANATRTTSTNIGLQTNLTAQLIGAGVYAISKSSNLGLSTSFVRYNPVAYRLRQNFVAAQTTIARQANATRFTSNNLGLLTAYVAQLIGGGVYSITKSSNLGLQSATTRSVVFNRKDSDFAGLQSTYTRQANATRLLATTMAGQTAATKSIQAFRLQSSNVGLTTVLMEQLTALRKPSANVGTVSSNFRILNVARKDTEILGAQSTHTRQVSFLRALAHNLGLQDARTAQLVGGGVYLLTQSSLVGTQSAYVRIAIVYRKDQDQLGLQSTSERQVSFARKLTNNAGLQSAYARILAVARARQDQLGVQSSYLRQVTVLRALANNIGLQSAYARIANAARTRTNLLGLQSAPLPQLIGGGIYSVIQTSLVGTQTAYSRTTATSRLRSNNIGLQSAYARIANAARTRTNLLGLQSAPLPQLIGGGIYSVEKKQII